MSDRGHKYNYLHYFLIMTNKGFSTLAVTLDIKNISQKT